ncbi:MAG TPA: peptidoglycan DD-metalloendopeptidase family protein [Gemmatimonadales bacterium]|nr:peptidoglycan DD-metalloendopeptidase family protein [Gemmatimonadales bacterium]
MNGKGRRGTALLDLVLVLLIASPLPGQKPATFDQQMRDNQRRLEDIRKQRTQAEQDLEALRTQAHSIEDEIANLERQKESTNRIVNEIDRQIGELGGQIGQTTVDLILAQDALAEKHAVLERRLVDIYKRGPLYVWQVLLSSESFGDLLSRYKYLYLAARQDRLLTNDMQRLQDRVARDRSNLLDARDALSRRRTERTDELTHYTDLESRRSVDLKETKRGMRRAEARVSASEREEGRLTDVIARLERERREALARGARAARATITTASLGSLPWPVDGSLLYRFGPAPGPDNTQITWHGVGIAAAAGTPVRAVAAGTVVDVGDRGTYLTTVILQHGGGYYTIYATLADATVHLGDPVVAGQVIGHVGGASTDQGAHLHFEIRGPDQIALDPLNWLKRQQ